MSREFPGMFTGMTQPVRCTWCHRVYDLGTVEVTARYTDCSMWKCPRCGVTVDDRGETGWKSRKDYERLGVPDQTTMSVLFGDEQPRELWVVHKLDQAGHIIDHHHATAHNREALAAWEALGEPNDEYPHGRYRVERMDVPAPWGLPW